MKKVRLPLTAFIIFASFILAAVGWMVLPDLLTLQITLSGAAGTTLPKHAGLAVPFLLSVVSAVLYYLHGRKKLLLVSVAGLAVFVFIFIMN